MAKLLFEKEIHKAVENTIRHYYLSVEVWIKFVPYDGNGLLLETSLADQEKNDQFLPAIRHGLEAGMSYYHLAGIRAILIDALLGSDQSCDVAFAWAAALALREAVSSGDTARNDTDDIDWLKAVGLYTENEDFLGAYQQNQIWKEHPWAKALDELGDNAKDKRLAILREAAATGDDYALFSLSMETDDQREKFLINRERAIRNDDSFSLVEVGEYYSKPNNDAPIDQDAVELFVKLGNAYMKEQKYLAADWITKMAEAYNRAWQYSVQLGISEKPFMSAFCERIGDVFANGDEPFHNTDTAVQWYKRAGTDNWSIRTKIALLVYDRDECVFLGDCYANGIPPAQMDLKLAEKFYQRVKTHTLFEFLECQNKCSPSEKIEYGQSSFEAMIEEKLGDLYSREGSALYDLDKAFNCYRAAANGSDTAKEKTIRVMRQKKSHGPNG